MKAVTISLYVCGGLMAAAAVLGAADYSKAQKKGTLNSLYKEEKQADPLIIQAKKEIDFEDYSRGPIEDYVEEKQTVRNKKNASRNTTKSEANPNVVTVETTADETEVKAAFSAEIKEEAKEQPEKDVKEFKQGRKKINLESFSRGPINKKFRFEPAEEYIKDSTVDLTTKKE